MVKPGNLDRWERIKELFHAALELASEKRPSFLDRNCGNDHELRAEVEMLLESDSRAEGFLEQ